MTSDQFTSHTTPRPSHQCTFGGYNDIMEYQGKDKRVIMTLLATDLQLILSQRLHVSYSDIQDVCQRWKIKEMALFGSVLRDDFDQESDIDILVVFQPQHGWSLFDLMDLQFELETLFNRSVDILQKKELINPHRRQEILRTHQLVYEQQ